jgi:hypothetical protein
MGEPDRLARALGPGRMPRLLMRYPRLCGIAMVAVGLWLWRDLGRVSEDGGVYFRSATVLAPVGLLLGAWFALTGRPADEEGYSPPWWNVAYVAVLVLAGMIALGWYVALPSE